MCFYLQININIYGSAHHFDSVIVSDRYVTRISISCRFSVYVVQQQ